MEQVPYALPGAVATYSAKSALFTAGYADRGTFFDSTGSFTITLDTTSMSSGWSAWFRTVSGTQTFDPTSTTLINGASTYAVSNAGDVVLVEYTGSAFVISQSQLPASVAITGGTINNTPIGGTTAAAGAFTTGSFTGAVSLTTASTGITISRTTGTTLTISSTAAAAIACSGGATFADTLAGSKSTNATYVGLRLTNADAGANARTDWTFIANDNTFTISAHGSTYTAAAARTGRMVFSAPSTSAGFRWETGGSASPGDFIFAPKGVESLTVASTLITSIVAVTLSTASSGLTIAKTTGTTLVVSSTADACATFAGGATFGSVVVGSASTTARATIRVPHGTAPTSPVDGDMWTTTAGLFVRINGVSVGPLS